ncbi:hypothetical protein GIB67_042297 [Kingdonia uniflora]|uniref:ATP-dependent RNA helicase n=1 Tax=Kingdonia uniflora TaxID=39325 RepID=A0A7J7KVP1_9MAGN|nr:hypothetical protein GIB67_020298 [Kingdonia uniflora]KAF6140884.1 hypothetical protein GIB67_042297 [Kingdonia uniflora]
MSGQIIPLRLLNGSVSAQSLLRGSILGKVFPFKNYISFSRNLGGSFVRLEESGIRAFSSGSFRSRDGGGGGRGRGGRGGRSSIGGFRGGRGGGERDGFKGGGFSAAAKSLVEDEAELSDWVSDLKSDKFRGGFSDGSDNDRGPSRDRGMGMDRSRGSGNGRGRGRGRDSFMSSNRRRDSDSDGFERSDRMGPRGASSRGSMRGAASRRQFGSDDSEEELPPRRGGFERRGGYERGGGYERNGGYERSSGYERSGRGTGGSFPRNSRGSMSGFVPKKRFGSESEEEFAPRRDYGSRGRGASTSFSRNSRGSMSSTVPRRSFGSSESDDSDEELPPMRDNGPRGAISSRGRRGGRSSDFSNARVRGGGALEREGRGGALPARKNLVITDEDDDDDDDDDSDKDLMSGFGDLLSDKDSDEDCDEDSDQGDEDDGVKDATLVHESVKEEKARTVPKISTGASDSHLSQTRFDQCSVSPLSLKGIKDAGYERMTMVQEATLPIILKGKDVLAKAKTGTGKTVAFLLPAIEAIVKQSPVGRDQKRPLINVLVVCPTRELANQAAAEANILLKYHPTIGVQVVIGGTKIPMEQKRLQANPCQILVATPGRLKDHIENTPGFATRLMGVKVLILDEADHLLDMGFRKDIEKIVAAVPKERQTLLFSATVPEEVRQICHVALKRDHEYINTVQEGSEETHSQVKQAHLVAPLDKQFSILYALLKEHISDDVDYKVLVFCTTAMVTKLVASLLSELNLNVREIHSRKPQSYRTRVSDEFRKSKGLILVTSDVSARGVDYPDVTLVIQIGSPSDREQYIHRLGRTGRKGKEGQGILVLGPWEESFLSSVKSLPISKAPEPSVDPETRKKVERALSHIEMNSKEAAYQAWLGYYNSNKSVGRDKIRLVELANEFSRSMGLDNPPALKKLTVGKMGLKNVPGIRTK